MKSSAPAANTSSAKATAVQTRFTNFMPFCISMILSPRWEFSRWDILQSRYRKLSSVIAETLQCWVSICLRHPHIVSMTQWQKTLKREPARTKAELREMLTEAVRNTQPEPKPKSKSSKDD